MGRSFWKRRPSWVPVSNVSREQPAFQIARSLLTMIRAKVTKKPTLSNRRILEKLKIYVDGLRIFHHLYSTKAQNIVWSSHTNKNPQHGIINKDSNVRMGRQRWLWCRWNRIMVMVNVRWLRLIVDKIYIYIWYAACFPTIEEQQ